MPAKTQNPENSNLHGFYVYKPLRKGTKLLFQVIKAIINQSENSSLEPFLEGLLWKKARENGQNLVSGDRLCCQRYGRAMNWVDRPRTSADERMLSGHRAVVIVWWAVASLVVPFDLSFLREPSLWPFSGLKFCALTYEGSGASLLSL